MDERKLWLAALGAFLVYGIPYWSTPYSKLESAMVGPALLAIPVAAFYVASQGAAGTKRITRIVGSAVVAAIALRVIVDCLRDPTDHNLWPFELIIGCALGMPAAFAGAWLGRIAAGRRSGSGEGG